MTDDAKETEQTDSPWSVWAIGASLGFISWFLLVLIIALSNIHMGWSGITIFILPCMVFLSSLIALISIERAHRRLRGEWVSCVILLFSGFFIYVSFHVTRFGSRVVCGTNVKGLGNALQVYCSDHDGNFPGENWCDALILECDVSPHSFICPQSEAVEGESCYALNRYVLQWGDLAPSRIVALFETQLGRGEGRRTLPIRQRESFQTNELMREWMTGDEKVYPERWNQVGGPEDLSIGYHGSAGCNILFADGRSEFVRTEDLPDLRWDPKDDSIRWTRDMLPENDERELTRWERAEVRRRNFDAFRAAWRDRVTDALFIALPSCRWRASSSCRGAG